MTLNWLAFGAGSGFVAVAAGAFGAHGLKGRLAPELLLHFETGVRYQMYHALLLCVLPALIGKGLVGQSLGDLCGLLLVVGTVLFSGSLYVLCLSGQRWLGMVTPLGGLCLLFAWLILCISALKSN